MIDDSLGDSIGNSIVSAVLSPFFKGLLFLLGFLYLYLRYQRPQRVREQLAQQFGNSYVTAGSVVVQVLLQAIIIGLMLLLWIGAACSFIF